MDHYMYKLNAEGIHIINLAKTWEKLMIAARIIAAIPNPSDVLVSIRKKFSAIDVRKRCLKYLTESWSCSIFKIGQSAKFLFPKKSLSHCHHDLLTCDCLLIDRLQQRVRPESRPQVRHLHQGQLLGWQVDPRYPHQSEHQEVRFFFPNLYIK